MRNSPGKGPSGETRPPTRCPGEPAPSRTRLPVPRPKDAEAAAGHGTDAPVPLPRVGGSTTAPTLGPTERSAPPAQALQDGQARGFGSEGLRQAIASFFLLPEEEKASYFALIAGRFPNHAGALYASFESLDRKQKAIFVSLLANSRDVGVLLRSETGRLLIDGLLRNQASTILSSVEAMNPCQKKELRSLLDLHLPPRPLAPLAGPGLTGRRPPRGAC